MSETLTERESFLKYLRLNLRRNHWQRPDSFTSYDRNLRGLIAPTLVLVDCYYEHEILAELSYFSPPLSVWVPLPAPLPAEAGTARALTLGESLKFEPWGSWSCERVSASLAGNLGLPTDRRTADYCINIYYAPYVPDE